MNYVSIFIPFIGGLALFIYGMTIMAQGLQNAAGSKMKSILEKLTQNKVMGILLGGLVTTIVQSSSATTVMVVGFVNAGLMNLTQAMSVIMGANIGTTVTGWLVASSEWADAFNPITIAPLAVMIGVIMQITAKKAKHKEVAAIIIGFGILFIGMSTMSTSVSPLRESEAFRSAFVTLGRNPLLGILVGAAVTGIIQSSTASQGILLSLAAVGMVPFSAAVYITMGQNIGTCVTAIISGIGASKTAKCVGYMHLMFNVIGSIVFSIVAVIYFSTTQSGLGESIITQTQISIIHTVFNMGTTLLIFPVSHIIIRTAMKFVGVTEIVRDDESRLMHLDKRMLQTPGVAVEGALKETVRLGQIASESLKCSLEAIWENNPEKISQVKSKEVIIDKLCAEASQYIIELCGLHIGERENVVVTSLLSTLADIERIADHAENIAELAEELVAEGIVFSDMAKQELKELIGIASSSYENALKAFETGDSAFIEKTAQLEEQVDSLQKRLRSGHIDRLSNAECSVNSGIHFLEIISNLERISDHAMNIAEAAAVRVKVAVK